MDGELVDALLGDLHPLTDAQLLSGGPGDLVTVVQHSHGVTLTNPSEHDVSRRRRAISPSRARRPCRGFADVELRFLHPDPARLEWSPDAQDFTVKPLEPVLERLNEMLFGPRDVAVLLLLLFPVLAPVASAVPFIVLHGWGSRASVRF